MDVWVFCDLYGSLLDATASAALWPETFGHLAAARWGGDPARWAAAQRTAGYRLAVTADLPLPLVRGALAGSGLTDCFHRLCSANDLGVARVAAIARAWW